MAPTDTGLSLPNSPNSPESNFATHSSRRLVSMPSTAPKQEIPAVQNKAATAPSLVAARLVPSTSRVICKRAWSRQEHHRDRLSLVVRIYPPVLIWFPRNFSVPIRHQSPLTAPAVQPYVLHLPLPQPFELSFHRHLQEVRVLS